MRQFCCYCKAKMAASKMFSIRHLPLLIPSTCWNVAQRNYVKEKTLLKKLGYPEKPKRPPTGFILFCTAKRPAVLAQNPNISFGELSIIMGKQWKALPEAERQKYVDKFQKEYADYKIKIEEYNKSLTDRQREEIRDLKTEYVASKKENSVLIEIKKTEKQLKKPKRPVSPFVVFCSRIADSYQGLTGAQRLKKYAEEWKNLSETDKEKYRDIFNKNHEQYKKDLLKWEEQMIQQGNLDLVRLKTIKQKLQSSN